APSPPPPPAPVLPMPPPHPAVSAVMKSAALMQIDCVIGLLLLTCFVPWHGAAEHCPHLQNARGTSRGRFFPRRPHPPGPPLPEGRGGRRPSWIGSPPLPEGRGGLGGEGCAGKRGSGG